MNYREIISNNIKERLKQLNITQKDFASKVGVKPAAVNKWVLGTQVPDIDLIPSVCSELGLSLNELFGIDSKNADITEALKLYKAYQDHPAVRESVDILLERRER